MTSPGELRLWLFQGLLAVLFGGALWLLHSNLWSLHQRVPRLSLELAIPHDELLQTHEAGDPIQIHTLISAPFRSSGAPMTAELRCVGPAQGACARSVSAHPTLISESSQRVWRFRSSVDASGSSLASWVFNPLRLLAGTESVAPPAGSYRARFDVAVKSELHSDVKIALRIHETKEDPTFLIAALLIGIPPLFYPLVGVLRSRRSRRRSRHHPPAFPPAGFEVSPRLHVTSHGKERP